MNKKDLEKLGLTAEVLKTASLPEDLLDQIIVLHGKDIETHKDQLKTLTTEKEGLEGQLSEANKTIAGFEKLDPEALKASVEEWKGKAEAFEADAKAAKEEADKQIAQHKFNTELAEEIKTTFHAIDPTDILHRLDVTKIQHGQDGKGFIGLKEQIDPLLESHKHLFTPEENGDLPEFTTPTKKTTVIDDKVVAAAREAAGVASKSDNKE